MALNFLNNGYFAGKVGIGTETLSTKLTISGQQELLQLTRGGASDTKWFFSADAAKLYIAEDTSATANIKLTITDTGNVGIGTISPTTPLSIESSGADQFIKIENTTTYTGLWMNDSGTNNGWQVLSGYTDAVSSGDFAIREYGVQTSLTIKQTTGNVGIGVTGPSGKLDVQGGEVMFSPNTANKDTFLFTTGGVDKGFMDIKSDTTVNARINADGASFLLGGSLGIGVTSPVVTAWGSAAATRQIYIAGTNYGVITLQGSYNQLTKFSVGAGDGIFYMAYDNVANAHRMEINSTGTLKLGAYDSTNNTGTPTYILGTDASGNVVKVLGGNIPGVPAGSGTLNTVAMWTPDGDTLGNSPITISGNNSTFAGNVSTAADKRISIGTWDNSVFTSGNAYGYYVSSSTPMLILEESDQSKTGYVGVSGGNMYVGGVVTSLILQSGSGSNALTIDSSQNATFTGNVGIGGPPLGNPGTDILSVGVPATTAGGIQLWASAAQTHYLQFGDANSGGEVYRGGIGYNHASETLLFLQASSTALSFTGSQAATFTGDVTISKTGGLDAKLNLSTQGAGGSESLIYFSDLTDGVGRIRYDHNDGSPDEMSFYTASTKRFYINGSGNATFTGTINSGSITSTGIITAATTFKTDSGSMSFFVPNVGQAFEIAQNTGDATFTTQAFATVATSTGDASSTLTTKGYVDGLITGATIYRGTWQAGISATSTGTTTASTTLTVSAAILDAAGNTPTLVGAVVTGAGITGTVKVSSVTSSTVYVLDTAIDATATAYIFSPIYGAPDLSGVTQTSGYYYICSEAGSATPNGAGTEPNTWGVGDWVIWNDDVGASGEWQKVDNSSVLSGAGTGQTVALWEGPSSVTDSETLGNAPITVSGNNTTFAGNVISKDTIWIQNTAGARWQQLFDGNSFNLRYYNGSSWSADALAISTSNNATFAGNVGIGVTPVSRALQVHGATSVFSTMLVSDSTSGTTGTGGGIGFQSDQGQGVSVLLAAIQGIKENSTAGSQDGALIFVTKSPSPHTLAERMRITSGGNVGIGTDSPTYKLVVGGDVDYSSGIGTTNAIFVQDANYPSVVVGVDNQNYGYIKWDVSGGYLSIATKENYANQDNTLIIKTGNVGIGTTGPKAKLEVAASVNGNPVTSGSSQTNGALRVRGSATNVLDIGQQSASPYAMWMQVCESTSLGVSYPLVINPNGGNVGIGTTGPDGKLDVAQNMTAGTTTAFTNPHLSLTALNATDNTGFVGMTFATSDSVNYGWSWGALRTNGGLGDMVLRNHYNSAQGTEKMRILANGNVGIGVDDPDAKLEIKGTGALTGLTFKTTDSVGNENFFIQDGGRTGVRFYPLTIGLDSGTSPATGARFQVSTTANDFVVLNDSSTGIGTITPQSKLQVAGGIQMADDDVDAVAAKAGTMRYRTGTEYVEITGTELVTNGDFATGSGWSGSYSITGGQLTKTTGGLAYQPSVVSSTKYYRVVVDVVSLAATTNIYAGGTNSSALTVGINSFIIQAGSTNTWIGFNNGYTGTTGSVFNSISVVEVTAEDASYADMCMQTGASTYEWVNIVRNTY